MQIVCGSTITNESLRFLAEAQSELKRFYLIHHRLKVQTPAGSVFVFLFYRGQDSSPRGPTLQLENRRGWGGNEGFFTSWNLPHPRTGSAFWCMSVTHVWQAWQTLHELNGVMCCVSAALPPTYSTFGLIVSIIKNVFKNNHISYHLYWPIPHQKSSYLMYLCCVTMR